MIKNTDNKNLKSIRIEKHEETEDVTKYGEFISSYFAWIGLDKQKENVERIEKITSKNQKE